MTNKQTNKHPLAFFNFFLLLICLSLTACDGPSDPPPPPPPSSPVGTIDVFILPNFGPGTPPCSVSTSDKQWIYIEIWSYDFNQGKHVKFGNTIRKTEADYSNGTLKIDVPKEGTFYLDVEIIKDCNDCCGKLASNNPDKCQDSFTGKPQWKYKTTPSSWQQSITVPVNFNTCKCEC